MFGSLDSSILSCQYILFVVVIIEFKKYKIIFQPIRFLLCHHIPDLFGKKFSLIRESKITGLIADMPFNFIAITASL